MYLDVLVEYNIDKTFEYKSTKKIDKFSRVRVPFNNRFVEGVVVNIKDNPSYDVSKILEVEEVIDNEALINEELFSLASKMSKFYFNTLINALLVMLPPSLKISSSRQKINEKTHSLYTLIKYEEVKSKKEKYVLDLLNGGTLRRDQIEVPKYVLNKLVDKGLIKCEIVPESRINIKTNNAEYKLTEEQEKAASEIIESKKLINLLFGVTGSGKTFVYLELIKKTIKAGKTVIMLVPEISLTDQTIDFFRNYLDIRMAIFHSGLSVAEKHEEYLKIKRGEVDLVIGARSAVFVPLNNIGLIIIDEEHTTSYRQDKGILYDTLDISKMRAEFHDLKIVLGSATPLLYTYANALKGNYGLSKLTTRPPGINLPNIKIVDLKKERGIFSKYLVDAINSRIAKNEQIIIMLNRRGFETFAECISCGEALKCPNCDISLTYHKAAGVMLCHYCSYEQKYSKHCPNCHRYSLNTKGLGTEKVAEELEKLFKVKVMRMDYDTTRRKGAYNKIIKSFKNGEALILVGTQMISKGLNFKGVTLSVALNADTGLNIPSFKATEDSFSLLLQTAGRAGRSGKPGEVIIQTYNPEHFIFQSLKKHDYDDFFKREMLFRRALKYPPYYYLVEVKISHKDEEKLLVEASKIKSLLENKLKDSIILGPSPAPIYKIKNNYQYLIYIKYQKEKALDQTLNFIFNYYALNKFNITINRNTSGI